MKITAVNYEIQFNLNLNKKNVIVIENPLIFKNFIMEFIEMIQGKDGTIYISEDEKTIDMKDSVEILLSPMDFNLSSKKILNKLYSELKDKAYNEAFFEKTMKLQSEILQYLYELENNTEYILTINDMDILGIFKSFGIEIECSEKLEEKVDSYIKVISRLLNTKILILINFSSYFSEQQISLFQKCASYEELTLIFIESNDKINSNNKIIIDKDQCRIL